MAESFRTRLKRWGFNWFPAYRGTGARLTYLADDFSEIRIELRLSRRTRNYVGTIYGGSMYGAVDPLYMVMLIHRLGPGYVVWDKSASIRFLRPGRTTLYARFVLSPEEVASVQEAAETAPSVDRTYEVELVDAQGVPHARIEKVIYVKKKR